MPWKSDKSPSQTIESDFRGRNEFVTPLKKFSEKDSLSGRSRTAQSRRLFVSVLFAIETKVQCERENAS